MVTCVKIMYTYLLHPNISSNFWIIKITKKFFSNVNVILLLAAGSTGGKNIDPPLNNYLGGGVGFPNNYRQLILMFQGLLISNHMHQIISSQSSLTTWK